MEILAAINGKDLVQAVVYLIVLGIVFALLWWLVDYCAKKFSKAALFFVVAKVILAIAAVLVLINFLLSLVSEPFIKW